MIKSFFFMYVYYYPLIMIMSLIMILSIPFKHKNFSPIILITMLMFLTFIISMKLFLLSNNWISLSLFLIMVGGLMIIFLYITSISNNELLNMPLKSLFLSLIKMFMFMSMMLLLMKMPMMNLNMELFYDLKNYSSYSNFYNEINLYILYFLMNYLYYALICIMNICYKFNLPTRQLSN